MDTQMLSSFRIGKFSSLFSEQLLDKISSFTYLSVYYLYYEQYLNIWNDTFFSLGLSLAATFLVTFLFTGKLHQQVFR